MSNLAETLAKQQAEIEDLKRRLSKLENKSAVVWAVDGTAYRRDTSNLRITTCGVGDVLVNNAGRVWDDIVVNASNVCGCTSSQWCYDNKVCRFSDRS